MSNVHYSCIRALSVGQKVALWEATVTQLPCWIKMDYLLGRKVILDDC